MRCKLLLTIVTLHVQLSEFRHKCLLHFCLVVQLLLYCYFDFDSLRVTLSPNEPCVDNFGLVEPFDLFEQ